MEKPDGTPYMGTKREFYTKAKDVQFDRDSSELSSCRSCFENEDSYEGEESKDEGKLEKMEIESDDEEETESDDEEDIESDDEEDIESDDEEEIGSDNEEEIKEIITKKLKIARR